METITVVVEVPVVAEEDRMIEEEVEKEIDQTEMEEAEAEEKMEKQENASSLRIRVSASLATSADLATLVEEEVKVRTDHLVEMGAATAEEEEMEAEEEVAKAAIALAASQLILPLHQGSQCHLKPITSDSKLPAMAAFIFTKSIGVPALTSTANT